MSCSAMCFTFDADTVGDGGVGCRYFIQEFSFCDFASLCWLCAVLRIRPYSWRGYRFFILKK